MALTRALLLTGASKHFGRLELLDQSCMQSLVERTFFDQTCQKNTLVDQQELLAKHFG